MLIKKKKSQCMSLRNVSHTLQRVYYLLSKDPARQCGWQWRFCHCYISALARQNLY